MNIEEYISSGILESYVLGETSDSENALISCLVKTNSNVAAELKSIQEIQEQIAFNNAQTPPNDLKSKIWNSIVDQNNTIDSTDLSSREFSLIEKNESKKDESVNQTIILRPNKSYWIGIAASFIALISFGIFSVHYMNLATKYAKEIEKIKDKETFLNKNLALKSKEIKFLSASNTKKIVLNGIENKENYRVVAHWNENDKKLVLSEIQLPTLKNDKQYQLWALIDGKPHNAGILNSTNIEDYLEMIPVEKPQAFAITIEPNGGSEVPHLEDLCVLGEVK